MAKKQITNVSVVICTFNRAELLNNLLESLCDVDIPNNLTWELVIVDNNSIDGTKSVIDGFSQHLPIIYLHESKQGKSYALNTAIKHVQGAFLLFVDDDIKVSKNWILEFLNAEKKSTYYWFGGQVTPDWNTEPPHWLQDETKGFFGGYFGDYSLGSQDQEYTPDDKLPLGASLALRKELLDQIGVFREDLGPRGDLRGIGDETELIQRAITAGYKGWYVANNPVKHHVPNDRLQFSGFVNYGLGKGINLYRMGIENYKTKPLFYIYLDLLRGLFQLVKGRGDRFRICLINYGIELGRRKAASSSTQ